MITFFSGPLEKIAKKFESKLQSWKKSTRLSNSWMKEDSDIKAFVFLLWLLTTAMILKVLI